MDNHISVPFKSDAPEAATCYLHPAWNRALDETMSIELALELAEVLSIGCERDLILHSYIEPQNMQPALDILFAAGQIVVDLNPAHAEHLISTYAHLAWILGDLGTAEIFSTLALRINPKNVLGLITLAGVRNPEQVAQMKEQMLQMRRGSLTGLLLEVVKLRRL